MLRRADNEGNINKEAKMCGRIRETMMARGMEVGATEGVKADLG